MPQKIIQVDAFTNKPFKGNPAAVCIMEKEADEDWMQLIAREMNLSETAFLYPIEGGYHLRWFTPAVEVDLCGHATLASAHVLFEDRHVDKNDIIKFNTKSGWLSASKDSDWIILDFPSIPPKQIDPPEGIAEIIGAEPIYVGVFSKDTFVELKSDEIVRSLKPNLSEFSKLPNPDLVVTAIDSSGKATFVSRFFAPSVGIPEDPVTGSIHSTLTPYWSTKLGKDEMIAHQVSERYGILKVKLDGDRVKIGGQAVITMRGDLV
jgi:PhzF family phenazine biosynthesis protein